MNIYGMRECNTILGQKCDTCGNDNLTEDKSQVSITINFGWGSQLDGEEYHFCNLKCLLTFINAEITKENK